MPTPPGMVLCRSSPSCSASLCLPGVSWVSNSDLPSPKWTHGRRALDDVLAGRQAVLIDADVIVRDAGAAFVTSPGGTGEISIPSDAELHVDGAGHRRVVFRLDEEHDAAFFAPGGSWSARRRMHAKPATSTSDRQHELLPDFISVSFRGHILADVGSPLRTAKLAAEPAAPRAPSAGRSPARVSGRAGDRGGERARRL